MQKIKNRIKTIKYKNNQKTKRKKMMKLIKLW